MTKFQTVGSYQGIDIFVTMKRGKIVFVAWMDKFYESRSVETIYTLIDEWWKLRRN